MNAECRMKKDERAMQSEDVEKHRRWLFEHRSDFFVLHSSFIIHHFFRQGLQ
jgi:hypothetical protein